MYRACLLSLFLLAACGGPPFAPAQECTVEDFGRVYVEDMRDCACVARVLHGARDSIRESFGDPSIRFPEVDVWVQSAPMGINGTPERIGVYTIEGERGRVVLARDMRAAAHELLHHVELRSLNVSEDSSVHHRGWRDRRFDVRPFTMIEHQFKEAYTPPRVETCPVQASSPNTST